MSKQDIQITDIKLFKQFLGTIIKFVPSAEFEVTEEKTIVRSKNEAMTQRLFLETNSMVAVNLEGTDTVKFCFNDINKFLQSLNLLNTLKESETINLEFVNEKYTSSLQYNDISSFKLQSCKKDIIVKLISDPVKSGFTYGTKYKLEIPSSNFKNVTKAFSIVDEDNANLYITKKKNSVVVEIEDKINIIGNAFGIEITDNIVEGDITDVVCVSFDDFTKFSILPSDNVEIIFTDKKFFVGKSEMEKEGKFIKMQIFVQIKKG